MAVKQVQDERANVTVIEGFASTPDLDRYRDIVEPKAFDSALELFMKNPVMLYQHDAHRPVGTFTSVTVTGKGLKVRGEVIEEDSQQKVKDGRLRAFSIGYIPLETALMVQKDDGSLRDFNWDSDSPWDANVVRVIKKLDLVEISLVSTPANGNALFTMAKSFQAFAKQLALKGFQTKDVDGEKPANETDSEEAEPAAPEAEEVDGDIEEPAEDTKPEGEETEGEANEEAKSTEDEPADEEAKPEETAAEGTQTSQETEGEAKEAAPEDAENGGETTPADGAEGGEKPAEEAKADAEPEEGDEDETEETEGKAIVATKEAAAMLSEFKDAGLIREQGEGEKATLTKSAATLMRKLIDALDAENKRADSEQKRANDLQEKLNAIPEKKALAPHAQFDGEQREAGAADTKEPSVWFKKLFNL